MKYWIIGNALALALSAAYAQPAETPSTISPNGNLKADGMPPLPASIAAKVAPYTEFRGHGFVDWHPKQKAVLVRHREAGANIAQIYQLAAPGGTLERLTDFPDVVSAASYEPVHGKYMVYARDTGGNEATQIYRMDLPSKTSTLLSRPEERSAASWNHKGDRLLIASVPLDRTAKEGKRAEVTTHISLVDPLQPQARVELADLPGGGWGNFNFSADDRRIAALQYRTPSDSDVFLIDAKTGSKTKILPKQGEPAAGFGDMEWSKDGKQLYLTTNAGGEFFELAVYTLKTQKLTVLSRHIPWDVKRITLSKDGKRLLAVVNNNGRDEVRLFDTVTGKELARPDIPAGSIAGGKWHTASKGTFAFSLNSSQSPGDVYSYDMQTKKTQRWTTA